MTTLTLLKGGTRNVIPHSMLQISIECVVKQESNDTNIHTRNGVSQHSHRHPQAYRSMACEDAVFHLLTLGVTLHAEGAVRKLPEFAVKTSAA